MPPIGSIQESIDTDATIRKVDVRERSRPQIRTIEVVFTPTACVTQIGNADENPHPKLRPASTRPWSPADTEAPRV